jgi:transposase
MVSRPPLPLLAGVLPPASTLTLSPAPDDLVVDAVAATPERIVVQARTIRSSASCPLCGRRSRRVHSRYVRRLADLPWQGIAVQLLLTTRRFVCEGTRRPRRIFTEPLPGIATRYARQTTRLDTTMRLIAAALGGSAGQRLAAALGMHAPGSTLLRHLRHAPAPDPPTPRVVGVDDFAWRRGRRYGTVLVDLERHRVIDVLPDRSAATFAAWLRAHPGIEIVSRDRGGPYAEAVRAAAPDAVQVADRFHLVSNLRAALEAAIVRHADVVRIVAGARPVAHDVAAARRRAARVALYAQVVALRDAGVPHVEICERLNLGHGTVRTWLRAGQFPERAAPTRGPRVPTKLALFVDVIRAQLAAGAVDGHQLVADLRARGYTGATHAVQRLVARLRREGVAANADGALDLPSRRVQTKTPSPRQVSWLLFTPDVALPAADRAFVAALVTACPPLADARAHTLAFRRLLAEHNVHGFLTWLARAHLSELRGFVRGLRYDFEAVYAAITLPWS